MYHLEVFVFAKRFVRWFGLLALWLVVIPWSNRLNAQTQAAPQNVVVAPVTLNGKALFQVRGILSFSAEARAAAITKRITDLSKNVTLDPKSLAVSDAEGTFDIVAGDLVLMSVTD
jgi:hypothetical protein